MTAGGGSDGRGERRGTTDRRGSADQDRGVTGRAGAGGVGAARGGLSEARRYTPRGRTVREQTDRTKPDRIGRGDPFRPAFEVLEGGRGSSSRARSENASPAGRKATPAGRKATPAGPKATPAKAPSTKAAPTKANVTKTRPGKATRSTRNKGDKANKPRTASAKALRTNRKPRPAAPPRPADPRRRLRLATVLALALFALIGGRLVQLQLTDARAYAADGLKDRLRKIDVPAPRGAIYDRDGNILVHSVEARYVYADPTGILDPEETADKLFPVLAGAGVTRSELVTKMTRHKRDDGSEAMFEYLARGVDIEVGEAAQGLKLPGIGVRRDERREVPGRDLAANILGFTGGGDHRGLTGLEDGYDAVLRGKDGKRTFEVGVGDLGKEIPGGYVREEPARPGSALQLTIDRDLQYEAQSTLFTQLTKVQATFGCAVVLDAHTSEVLAQASYPSYSAAKPYDSPPAARVDACTETVFDPGSVHKAIVMGGALQEGLITPDTIVSVPQTITKADQTYRDHDPVLKEVLMSIPGILALSSNVGTIKVADQLGAQKLYQYQQSFGLGRRTGVGLPAEASGAVLPPERWTGSSPGSIPIGASVATTTMQMACAYAAIANNGVYTPPRLVRGTVAPGGKVARPPDPASHRVIDPQHAAELRQMLEAVTSPTVEGATGKYAGVPGYRVAGKTGTGQFPREGGYAPGDVVSFTGMAPADAPRYVIAVFAHVPDGRGGVVAGPIFRDLMQFALAHYQVPPTGTAPPTFKVYP